MTIATATVLSYLFWAAVVVVWFDLWRLLPGKLWGEFNMADRNLRRKVARALDTHSKEFDVGGAFFHVDTSDLADWLATLPAFAEYEPDQVQPYVEKWLAENKTA